MNVLTLCVTAELYATEYVRVEWPSVGDGGTLGNDV